MEVLKRRAPALSWRYVYRGNNSLTIKLRLLHNFWLSTYLCVVYLLLSSFLRVAMLLLCCAARRTYKMSTICGFAILPGTSR